MRHTSSQGQRQAQPDPGMPDLVPARMLNEYAYCPRLFYLEWVQGEFEDSADTVEGRLQHRRVDQEGGSLPTHSHGSDSSLGGSAAQSEEDSQSIHARSVLLSAPQLGAIARIDLLEGEGKRVTPVDYKHGTVPDVPEGAWEPERVQLCLQGLILRENGYECDEGVLYYTGSRQRVVVRFDDALVARVHELLDGLRSVASATTIPPPLSDSPKCPRCSLVGICLPDEVNLMRRIEPGDEGARGSNVHPAGPPQAEVRRLIPARDDSLPVYVQAQGVTVAKNGDVLEVRERGRVLDEVRLIDVSQLCLFGNVQITPPALRELVTRGIPICHFTYGGWFVGVTHGMDHKNVELRIAQYRAAGDTARAVALGRRFIQAKVRNGRTLLRRNQSNVAVGALEQLRQLAHRAGQVRSLDTLLGIEGTAARVYFSQFATMLRPREGPDPHFDFESRNRRPPRDPVNALLSFGYALLVKDLTVILQAVGFDPYLGFFHQPRYGRPALALDLMEEFRPLIVDSVVLTTLNTGEISSGDFIRRAGSVALTAEGRRKFLAAYERRMDTLVTHPVFGYTISYRRVLEVQARLLGRHLMGEIPEYPAFTTR